jgi:hypothetical protein
MLGSFEFTTYTRGTIVADAKYIMRLHIVADAKYIMRLHRAVLMDLGCKQVQFKFRV